jgi:hypothetical protein
MRVNRIKTLARSCILWVVIFGPLIATGDESDIRLETYAEFEKKWKLVTVRFRKDTGELRFTYANPVAWSHMMLRLNEKTTAPYPKGAVFAKTGIATHEDELFPSSAVPRGVRRFQLMVRDDKKYAQTDGWGYALFTEDKQPAPGSSKQTALACAACHKAVLERDFIFSLPMAGLAPKSTYLENSNAKKWSFEDAELPSLPGGVIRHVPAGVKAVRLLFGEVTKHVFEGTLDEIRPLLTRESQRANKPSLLLSENKKYFSLVFAKTVDSKDAMNQAKACPVGETMFLAIAGTVNQETASKVVHFCYKAD